MPTNSDPTASNTAGNPRELMPRRCPSASLPEALTLATNPRKPAKDARSPDPYNSSGSFDRTKNWARVGKR